MPIAGGDSKRSVAVVEVLQSASEDQRIATIPALVQWADDPRPEVRGFALGLIGLIYYAFPPEHGYAQRPSLSPQYIPRIAAHLQDTDVTVRQKAAFALQTAGQTPQGHAQLEAAILPMLHAPGAMTRYPDPLFTNSDAYILAHAPPAQQQAIRAMQAKQKPMLLPAIGTVIFGLLVAPPSRPSAATSAALLAFLQRNDQTADTLSDSLHTIALSFADDALANEALTRVFDKRAMSVFLLQFVSQLQLTPQHLAAQKARLLALSADPAQSPPLRQAAATVAACWTGDIHVHCAPTQQQFFDSSNPARPPQ